jgi:hypothetical protein
MWRSGWAEELLVWQIGQPDRDFKEFAIAGNYKEYHAGFPRDVNFTVGQSDPKKDWPFVQPGPLDHWAGAKAHAFKITFALAEEPKGAFRLRASFVNAQGIHGATIELDVNGTKGRFVLPKGGSDVALTDSKQGKPDAIDVTLDGSLFRKGQNQIILKTVAGSWAIYDAVELFNDEAAAMRAEVRKIWLKPTALMVRREDGLRRMVQLMATVNGRLSGAEAQVRCGETVIKVAAPGLAGFGTASQDVYMPDVTKETEVEATLRAGGRELRVKALIKPVRRWKLYVAPSSHTDIGYTDVQPKCAEVHNKNIDTAIELCKEFPDFKWNCEVAWQVENYLRDRPKEKVEEFLRLAREGRIGVQALYANILTGLCSHEALNRICYYAYSLHKKYGIPYKSAMISDVPTQVWTLPTVLAQSGIKYFSTGINATRGYTFTEMPKRSPYYWQGPDGSKVLTWATGGYAQAQAIGLTDSFEAMTDSVTAWCARFDREDYPYDAIFLHGAYGDNQPLTRKLAELAHEWNQKIEYPKIILCTNDEFFEYIERNFGDKVPTISGDGGVYWEDGAGSSASETAMDRMTQDDLLALEMLWTLLLATDSKHELRCPEADINNNWRNCLLYDEHTWGAAGSISQPEAPQTVEQWKIKASFARSTTADAMVNEARRLLGARLPLRKPDLCVVNPLGWKRSDFAVFGLLGRELPAMGYKCFALPEKLPEPPKPVRPEAPRVESPFYRLELDPKTGGIKSIYDKECNRELVDAASPYTLNQYVYVSGGENTKVVDRGAKDPPALTISTPTLCRWRVVGDGLILTGLNVEATTDLQHRVRGTITLHNTVKKIRIYNLLDKPLTYKKEAAYFAFPFAAQKPEFQIMIPNGTVRPNADQLPGACKDWYCVRDSITVGAGDFRIIWTSLDAPLVTLCDINRGLWQTELPLCNGWVFSYIFNNYWFTNYKAGQKLSQTFRYVITSGRKMDAVAAARKSWEADYPVRAIGVEKASEDAQMPPEGTLCTVDEPNVFITTVKPAEDGQGFIVRLLEVAGTKTNAHLKLGLLKARKAFRCTLVEEPMEELKIENGMVSVEMPQRGIATIRLE